VDVTIELSASGAFDTILDGFNYVPSDTQCYEAGILGIGD